jgi:lantibiotic biosynthesis protein
MHEAGVADASLCHGALGIAHLYRVGYYITNSTTLLQCAQKWLHIVMYNWWPEGLVSCFATSYPGSPPIWRVEYGFYTGLAGIGLALASSISEEEPSWDMALGVSPSIEQKN